MQDVFEMFIISVSLIQDKINLEKEKEKLFSSAKAESRRIINDRTAQAEELLCELGISDTDLYPDELSGGMKARVSIARALAVNADLYLFDEPFANLDAKTALLCAEVIKRKTEDSLTVAVIHDTSLAERIADKVIFLK